MLLEVGLVSSSPLILFEPLEDRDRTGAPILQKQHDLVKQLLHALGGRPEVGYLRSSPRGQGNFPHEIYANSVNLILRGREVDGVDAASRCFGENVSGAVRHLRRFWVLHHTHTHCWSPSSLQHRWSLARFLTLRDKLSRPYPYPTSFRGKMIRRRGSNSLCQRWTHMLFSKFEDTDGQVGHLFALLSSLAEKWSGNNPVLSERAPKPSSTALLTLDRRGIHGSAMARRASWQGSPSLLWLLLNCHPK